jgi:[protein-PII] uridylyltransferase
VVGAQIYSWVNAAGVVRVLDLFWVRFGSSTRTGSSALKGARENLGRLLRQEISAEELVRAGNSSSLATRSAPSVPTVVFFDNRSGSNHSVLEIITQDRPGLLFALAATLERMGLTISLAKINTEGHQVADVFYVTDASGAKIVDVQGVERVKEAILKTIHELEEAENK